MTVWCGVHREKDLALLNCDSSKLFSVANSSLRCLESILILPPPPPLPYLALQSGGGRDAKKHETVPSGFKLHPYLRGNRPFIRSRVAIDLRMRKWKDYSVMERAITGLRGSKRAQPVSEYLSVHCHWSGYLFIRETLADGAAWPLERPLSGTAAERPLPLWRPLAAQFKHFRHTNGLSSSNLLVCSPADVLICFQFSKWSVMRHLWRWTILPVRQCFIDGLLKCGCTVKDIIRLCSFLKKKKTVLLLVSEVDDWCLFLPPFIIR